MAFSKEHWKKERIAKGLCIDCGNPSSDALCEACRKNHAEIARASAYARVRAGLCRQCGQPNPNNGPRCSSCLEQERRRYRDRAKEGLCVICGFKAMAGAFCFHHWFKNIGHKYGLTKKNGGIDLLKQLWEEQEGLCAVTGCPLIPGENASLDHKIPQSKGGQSIKENLQWVLIRVNHMKWDLTYEEFVEACREVVGVHDRKTKRSN